MKKKHVRKLYEQDLLIDEGKADVPQWWQGIAACLKQT